MRCIRAGARVDVRNALGVPPVYVAAQNGNAAMLRRLLDARADVNTADATGDTLLMAAVRSDSLEAVRLLVERGAHVNAADPDVVANGADVGGATRTTPRSCGCCWPPAPRSTPRPVSARSPSAVRPVLVADRTASASSAAACRHRASSCRRRAA